jgi:Flp pilus assembly protein TadG
MKHVVNIGLEQEINMIHRLCQRAFSAARNFLRNQSGSIVIYTGAFMSIGVGGAALSIDIGRIVLLKTQMQNRADAGALAGAAQLDAQKGAIDRARLIVADSMKAFTTSGADVSEVTTFNSYYYAPDIDYITRGPETADDVAARFVEVVMDRRTLSFFYGPALNIMTGKTVSSFTQLDARAVAMSDPFICKVQPMMICNPLEAEGKTPDNTYAGKSITLKQGTHGGGAWTSGNFGLLDLPTDGSYSGGGAVAVYQALSAEEPSGCYGYNIVTAPGSMTMNVANGLNERFGMDETDPTVVPAPNVIAFHNDDVMRIDRPAVYDPSLIIGDGNWDIIEYWTQNHSGVAMPAILAGATRYEVFLFEQDVSYYKKAGGKKVQFALTPEEISGGGWTYVQPALDYPAAAVIPYNAAAPDDVWTDGEPPGGQTVSPTPAASPTIKGYDRRTLRVNIMNCIAEGVKGKGDYGSGGNFLEIFLTKPADGPVDGASIYGEFIRKLDPVISLEFHGNVRLTE